MSIDHRTINIKSASQRKTINGCAVTKSNHPPQFRIIADVFGRDRFAFVENFLQNSFPSGKCHTHIGLRESPSRANTQLSTFKQQNRADQRIIIVLIWIGVERGKSKVKG